MTDTGRCVLDVMGGGRCQLWPTDAGIIMLCSNILINSWTNCSFYLLACSQAFPTAIVFMIMFQWYIVGGICSLSAIYPSISPTALFASFLAVCVVISNICYLSDNNCFHVPVLCVSPGRYNLKIHSVIEFNNNSVQLSISNNCDFYLIFSFWFVFAHVNVTSQQYLYLYPRKSSGFRPSPVFTLAPRGCLSSTILRKSFLTWKSGVFITRDHAAEKVRVFAQIDADAVFFALSRMSSSQRCHREKTSCCLK